MTAPDRDLLAELLDELTERIAAERVHTRHTTEENDHD